MSEASGTERGLRARNQERATDEPPTGQDEASWRIEIAMLLGGRCFPARLADLASHLAGVQAPSRLLWRLSGVSPDTRFHSLDALIAHIDSRSRTAPQPSREPM